MVHAGSLSSQLTLGNTKKLLLSTPAHGRTLRTSKLSIPQSPHLAHWVIVQAIIWCACIACMVPACCMNLVYSCSLSNSSMPRIQEAIHGNYLRNRIRYHIRISSNSHNDPQISKMLASLFSLSMDLAVRHVHIWRSVNK